MKETYHWGQSLGWNLTILFSLASDTNEKRERSESDSTPKYDMKQCVYIPTLELEFRSFFIATTKSSQGTFWCANT